jgi:SAM-dependent methyltransferase
MLWHRIPNLLETGRAARKWDRLGRACPQYFNWWNVPEIVQTYNEKVCGKRLNRDNAAGCRERLRQRWPGRKFERAVSIGCGNARKEMALVEEQLVEHFDLFDVSQQSIVEAQMDIEQRGLADHLSFQKEDPVENWGSRYDLVYWDHALHHMFDVERYVAWSKSVLKPGGVFLMNDYVGPNRNQWTKFNVMVCRKVIADLGCDTSVEKIRKSNFVSRLREYVRDPSEAAQSERILPSCKAQLSNLEFKPLGGFIYLVLGNRLEDFIENESAIRAIIDADNSLCQKYHHYAFVTWENC